jgi:hypothetical protein
MVYQTREGYQFTGMVVGAGGRTDETNVASSCHADSEEVAVVPCADVVESIRLRAVDRLLVVIDGTVDVVMGND